MADCNIPVGVQSWGLLAPGDSRLGVSRQWDLDALLPAFALGPARASCRYRCSPGTQTHTDPVAVCVLGCTAVGAESVGGCSLCSPRFHVLVGGSLALISETSSLALEPLSH